MSSLDRPSAGILLSEGPGEIRAVRLDHGLCIAFSTLRMGEPRPGMICRAIVRAHLPGIGSFLDLGEDAFLSGAGAENLPLGARLLVQVNQSASGDKPIGVTRRLRWETPDLALTLDAPGTGGVAVARKLPELERQRLKEFLNEQFPISRRRAGFTATALATAVKSPCQALVDQLHALLAEADRLNVEGPLGPVALPSLRCVHRLIAEMGREGKNLPILAPLTLAPILAAENRLCTYAPPSVDPFAALEIDAELAEACGVELSLPGGGWLTVEPTRAFVGIDIDSGRDPRPRNVFLSDALRAVARIVRLRNLSGTILIDPPRLGKAAFTQALTAFKAALAMDPIPSELLGVTRSGLIEIVRPRRAPALSERLFGVEGQALAILRRLVYDPATRDPIIVSAAQLNWLETPRGRAAREQAAQKLGRAPFFRVEER